jgi:hypothetical protein
MNRWIYRGICATFKIEKRKNKPDIIFFQDDDYTGFFAPKYIYVAFSEDMKTEYKAQSKEDLALYIARMKAVLKFKKKLIEAASLACQ